MNKYKICCVTYNKLTQLTKNAISMIQDDEIEVTNVECRHNAIFNYVNSYNSENIEVFVAGGSNFVILKNSFDYPVVPIELGYLDYFKCIHKASAISKKIAVVTYLTPPNIDLSLIEELLQLNITYVVYEYSDDLSEQLRLSDCEVVIGTSFAVEVANKLGKESILIYPGEDAIIKSIYAAKDLAREIRKHRERVQFLSAIIDYSPSGIISVDSKNTIENYNPSAEKILGVKAEDARGRSSLELFPELEIEKVLSGDNTDIFNIILYRGKEIYLSKIPVENSDGSRSAIAMFSESSTIRKAEIDYISKRNSELISKGFVAKYKFEDILGESKAIKLVKEQAKVYSNSAASILIYGETGTGKELFAQSIHNSSNRKNESFVAINCGAIPENLLESELFGYIEGAFTGSKKGGKKGLFELAEKGTLFLDEIGEIPHTLQIKLLRTLQEHEIMRIGDDRIIPVDVRVIAATNKSPQDMLAGGFRSDLLYRLNVLELEIPPLRNRGEDAIMIFKSLLQKHIDNLRIAIEINDEIFDILKSYSWPGNIRELENVSQRFALYLTRNAKFSNIKAIKKLLTNCIGEEKFFNDILYSYNYDIKNNHGEKVPMELVDTIKNSLGYSNEYIAKKLGTSRTSLWRNNKS